MKKNTVDYDTSNMGRPKKYIHKGDRKTRSIRATDDQVTNVLCIYDSLSEFFEMAYSKMMSSPGVQEEIKRNKAKVKRLIAKKKAKRAS